MKIERVKIDGYDVICTELGARAKMRLATKLVKTIGPGAAGLIPAMGAADDPMAALATADAGQLIYAIQGLCQALDPDMFEQLSYELLANTQVIANNEALTVSASTFDKVFNYRDELLWGCWKLALEVSMIPFFKGAKSLMPASKTPAVPVAS